MGYRAYDGNWHCVHVRDRHPLKRSRSSDLKRPSGTVPVLVKFKDAASSDPYSDEERAERRPLCSGFPFLRCTPTGRHPPARL